MKKTQKDNLKDVSGGVLKKVSMFPVGVKDGKIRTGAVETFYVVTDDVTGEVLAMQEASAFLDDLHRDSLLKLDAARNMRHRECKEKRREVRFDDDIEEN